MHKVDKNGVGKVLKELREGQGVTYDQMSRSTGIHTSTIWRVEKGVVDPDFITVQVLAGYLGYEVFFHG